MSIVGGGLQNSPTTHNRYWTWPKHAPPALRSEDELHAELNLARSAAGNGARDLTGALIEDPGSRNRSRGVKGEARQCEIGTVQDVQDFRAELNAVSLGDVG